MDEEEYVESFKPHIMDVMHAWCSVSGSCDVWDVSHLCCYVVCVCFVCVCVCVCVTGCIICPNMQDD